MPNVGSRYSKSGFEKKTAFGFEKKPKNCWGRIPGFQLSDKKKMCLWTLDYGGWGRHSDFSMVSVCLPFLKTVRLDWNWGIIHECSWTYRNNAILSFDFIICQSVWFLPIQYKWSASSEFVSSSIPSWQILTAHAQPFRGARDLAFCLKVPLDSLLVWASSGGSGETAWMRRLARTFAARIGDKYQIRLTRPKWSQISIF